MQHLKIINDDAESDSVEEILYAQRLGGNNQKSRTESVKDVADYFHLKSSGKGFMEDDLMKIWKGLYYCMYMADKLLFQENVAEDISCLIKSFATSEQRHLYFKTAMKTIAREWIGMDNFRADKFMMLMRRVLRQNLIFLRETGWSEKDVKITVKTLEETVIVPSDNVNMVSLGIKYHLIDILLEELAKIGGKNLPHSVILSFVYPYMKVLAVSRQKTYADQVRKSIFEWLIQQSKLGIKYEEDLDYGEIEVKRDELMDEDEKEEDELRDGVELDPRAGGVDVFLPTLEPDFDKIALALQSVGSLKEVNSQKRKVIYKLVKDFREAHSGIYPYAPPSLKMDKRPFSVPMINDAIIRVQHHDQELKKKDNPDHLGKNQKKKRYLMNRILPDNEIENAPPMPSIANEAPYKRRMSKKKKNAEKTLKRADPGKKKQKFLYSTTIEKAVHTNIEDLADAIGLPKSAISTPPIFKKKGKKKMDFFTKLSEKDFQDENCTESREKSVESKVESVQNSESKVKAVEKSEKRKKSKKLNKKKKIAQMQENNHVGPLVIKKKKSLEKSPKFVSSSATPNNKMLKQKKSLTKNKKLKNKSNGSDIVIKKAANEIKSIITPFNDAWSEPLKDGEFEYDVKSLKSIKKEMKAQKDKLNFKKSSGKSLNSKNSLQDKTRKLKINLLKNKEQELLDYRKVLQNSPAIPYSAEKKPRVSILKATDSPILIKKSFRLKRLR